MCDPHIIKKHNVTSVIPKRKTVIDETNRRHPTLAFLNSDTYTRTHNNVSEKDVQKWNWNEVTKPSSLQKKCLLALALMEIVRTTLGNHVYQLLVTIPPTWQES